MKILLTEEEIKQAIVDYLHLKTKFEFDIPDIILISNFEDKEIAAECKV